MNNNNSFRTRRIINKINYIKVKCSQRHLYDALAPLSNVAITVQENSETLNKKKIKTIKNSLVNINNSLDDNHLFEIKYECERINDIMLNKNLNLTKEEERIIKNNKRIIQLQDTISTIDNQIKNNDQEMDKYLGKNQMLWEKYNSLNKVLKQKRLLFMNQYKNSILFSQNMEMINDTKTIRSEYSEKIINDLGNVNSQEFINNMEMIDSVDQELKDQNNIIVQKLYESIKGEDDSEYKSALANKKLESSINKEDLVKICN